MSKTYTFGATLYGYRDEASSSVLNYALSTSPRVGKNGTYYHAVSIVPTGDWSHIYDLYAAYGTEGVTSVRLTLNHASGNSAPGKCGKLAQEGSAKSKCSGTMVSFATAKSSTSTTKEVIGCGVSEYGYAVGAAATTTNTVNVLVNGAGITVETNETDYTLGYDANGGTGAPAAGTGTGIDSYTFTVSDTAPARTGYSFLGWAVSASAATASYHGGDSLTVSADTTLYAVWSADTYAVTFYPNPGSGTPVELVKTYGRTLNACGKADTGFTRAGYDYDGWTDSAGGTNITMAFGGAYTANAATSFYARWTANTYTVGFNAHGGTACDSITVTYGSTYGELPVPTKQYYTFGGWWTEESGGTQVTSSTAVAITAAQTLHARWTANSYTVTYTDERTAATQSITGGTAWTVSAYTFTQTGHTQTSWNTAADGSGTTYRAGSSVSLWANLTLHAVFTPNTYTVGFNSHGGTACASKTVTYGQTYGTLPTPTRARYRFDGWFTAETGGTEVKSTDTVALLADTELHARWTLLETTYYYRCNVFVKAEGAWVPAVLGNMAAGAYRAGQTYYRYTEEGV